MNKIPFRPISKIQKFAIFTAKGKAIPTTLSLQYGYSDSIAAIKFFREGQEITTRKSEKNRKKWNFKKKEKDGYSPITEDLLLEFGCQKRMNAQFQREICLKHVTEHFFQQFGMKVIEEPYLFQKTPDLVAYNDQMSIYIELKAYYYDTLVAEPELAQSLMYFSLAYTQYLKAKENPDYDCPDYAGKVPKVYLVTSGNFNMAPEHPFLKDPDKKKFLRKVRKKYGKLIKQNYKHEGLDDHSSWGTYINGKKKFEKEEWEVKPKIHILKAEELIAENRDHLKDVGVFIIRPEEFEKMLTHYNLTHELTLFRQLQYSPIEQLMVYPNLIDPEHQFPHLMEAREKIANLSSKN